MQELKNHRQTWSNDEESILVDRVIQAVEKGQTQRDAFKQVSDDIGRTVGAIEYHWKKMRKENPDIMDKFQNAVADALIDIINDPQNPHVSPQEIDDAVLKEITKGATKIHRMIEMVINPGSGITLPPEVAQDLIWHIENYGDGLLLYNRKYLEENEYDHIMDYIDKSPHTARNFYRALENGFDIELTEHQKIRTIYDALKTIKPNEPGYMMARGMIVMMWHTIEILGVDAENMIGITRDMPF